MQQSKHACSIPSQSLQLSVFSKISQFLFFPTVNTEIQSF